MDLQKELDNLMEAFNTIKDEVRRRDPHLYERWKAGGFIVDGNIHSMYPNVEEVIEELGEEDHDEEDEEDETANELEDIDPHGDHDPNG